MPLCSLTYFLTGTYAVTRPGDGAYVDGRWVPVTGSTFNIDACVQPLNGKELRLLPEGFTVDGTKKVYTATLLRAGADASQSDLISIKSEDWRVIAVEDVEGWKSNGHYKAIVARVPSP